MTHDQTRGYVFRIHWAVPCSGAVVLGFWGYVVLYAMGIVDSVLFARVVDFREHSLEPAFFVFLGVMIGICAFLIITLRLRAELNEDSATYRGYFRTVTLLWRDVICVERTSDRSAVRLKTNRHCIQMGRYFARKETFFEMVFDLVRTRAPCAEVAPGPKTAGSVERSPVI